MQPRVTRRERKLLLTYELTHRVHCSCVYPLAAPNGSSVILCGHDSGLRVLWRGGRRLKAQQPPQRLRQPNGSSRDVDVVEIDDSEEEEPQDADVGQDRYEEEEEEQDADCPYPDIVQDVDVDLGTQVLRIALPSFPASPSFQSSGIAASHAIVALACSDGKISLLLIPLAPPQTAAKQRFVNNDIRELQLDTPGNIANDITIKLQQSSDIRPSPSQNDADPTVHGANGRLLISADTKHMHLWSVNLTHDSFSTATKLPCRSLRSQMCGFKLSFHPSSRSTQLLLADRAGAVRVYDPSPAGLPSESASSVATIPSDAGSIVMSYLTPFHTQSEDSALARRKRILGAEWVLRGRGILVLLEDGQWGIWDVTGGAQSEKTLANFTLQGFLDSSSTADVSDPSKQKNLGSKLAPMTPNTRKGKAENLFSGNVKSPGTASTGGISVTSSSTRSGQVDDSVIIWYNGAVYSIPSLQNFWQRSTNSGGGFGTLYAPGLALISGIDLMHENITSVSQFPSSKSMASNLGQMSTQRELLISAEHRFIISQSLRSQLPSGRLFQQQIAERPASRDQRMLDAGELDLDGMDRMLDTFADDARVRLVSFAH